MKLATNTSSDRFAPPFAYVTYTRPLRAPVEWSTVTVGTGRTHRCGWAGMLTPNPRHLRSPGVRMSAMIAGPNVRPPSVERATQIAVLSSHAAYRSPPEETARFASDTDGPATTTWGGDQEPAPSSLEATRISSPDGPNRDHAA